MNTKETNPPAGVTTLDRFETWFKANHHTRLDRKMADGSYNDPTAYAMWQAWQAGSIDGVKAVNAQQAERIKELEAEIITRASYGDEQTDFAIKLAAERDALRAELDAIAATELVAKLKPCKEGWFIDLDNPPPITGETIELFTRPMPAQIVGLQDVHDAITSDPTLAESNAEFDESQFKSVEDLIAYLNKLNSYRDKTLEALSKYKGAK